MLFFKLKNKKKNVVPKKSMYALTFGYIDSKKRLNKVVSTRYILEA